MKNKKGFTLIELLGVIILLGIIITIAVISYSSSLNKTKIKAFQLEEGNFVDATKSAYVDCLGNNPTNNFCELHQQLDDKNTYDFVYLKELIDDNYIGKIKNPYDTEQFCDFENSYVYVSRKNSSNANNADIVYKVCLICGDKKSENCLNED